MTPQQAAIPLTDDEAVLDHGVAVEPARLSIAPAAPETLDLSRVTQDASLPDSLQSNESLYRRMLAGADLTAIAAALILVLGRFGVGRAGLLALASMPVVLFLFKVTGLYNRDEVRLRHTTLDEIPLLVQLTGLLALGVAILHPGFAGGPISGGRIAALWLASFGAVLGGRVLARSAARRIVPVERCLIIGEARQTERIRTRIEASRARTAVVACRASRDVRTLGGPEGVVRLVRDLGVHRIIIAPISAGGDEVVELIRIAKAVGVRVSVLPRVIEVIGSSVAFDEVEGMAMLGVPRFGLCRSSRLLKRTFDLIAGTVGLVLISPLLAAIAVAIRLDSKGPIFFRQVRVGWKGEHFFMFKFRSMVADADTRKEELRSLNVAGAGLFKVENDPRVTRVGHFLRRTSLDELPQLFNVLRGEMSLVGPRPLVTDEDAQVRGLDRSRLELKPGMTGPWQLLGSRVPLQEMVGIDYLYASNWSLWLDVKTLLRTVQHVVRRGNL